MQILDWGKENKQIKYEACLFNFKLNSTQLMTSKVTIAYYALPIAGHCLLSSSNSGELGKKVKSKLLKLEAF